MKALLSLGILGAFAWVVDHRVLARLVDELHPGYLAALALLAILRMWIAALRIRTLTAHRITIPVHTLARQYFVGAYFNNLLPTSIGGDAVRLLMLARCGLPKSECAVYLVSERALGAIALQGVRQADPTLGEVIAVIGLGLIGQLTVQLLKANGCRVVGSDLDSGRVELARELGADVAVTGDLSSTAMEISRGRGVDAVILTASTSSNEPLKIAGEIARLKLRTMGVEIDQLTEEQETYLSSWEAGT